MKTFFQFMEENLSVTQAGKDQFGNLGGTERTVMNDFFSVIEDAINRKPAIAMRIIDMVDKATEGDESQELRGKISTLKRAMMKNSSEGEEAPAEAHPEGM